MAAALIAARMEFTAIYLELGEEGIVMERQKTKSRSERLEQARVLIEQINEEVEAETYGLSDGVRSRDKASRISETQSTLRQILNLMENIEFPSLSQPDHRKRA